MSYNVLGAAKGLSFVQNEDEMEIQIYYQGFPFDVLTRFYIVFT